MELGKCIMLMKVCLKETGFKICGMAKESWQWNSEMYTKEILLKTNCNKKIAARWSLIEETIYLLGSLKMNKKMVMEKWFTITDGLMKEIGRMESLRDMEFWLKNKEISSKEYFKREILMEKGVILIQMEINMKECLKIIRSMAMELWYWKMEQSMKQNGLKMSNKLKNFENMPNFNFY